MNDTEQPPDLSEWRKQCSLFFQRHFPAISSLCSNLAKFNPKAFYFESQIGGGAARRLSLAVVAVAVGLPTLWACGLYYILSDSPLSGSWIIFKTVVVTYSIIISSLYISTRVFRGHRCGHFLINVMSVGNAAGFILGLPLLLLGAVASGSLVSDISSIKSGHGRNTALYRAVCAFTELEIREVRLMSSINQRTGEYDFLDSLIVRRGEMLTDDQVSEIALQEARRRHRALPPAARHEHAVDFVQLTRVRNDMYILETDDRPIRYVLRYYWPMGAAVVIIFLIGLFTTCWELAFITIGIRRYNNISRMAAIFRIMGGVILSSFVLIGFVMLAEGTRLNSDYLDWRIEQVRSTANNLTLICGDFDIQGLW